MARALLCLAFAILLSGCGSGIHAGNYLAGRSSLETDQKIGDRDYDDLRAGRLTALKGRYEALPMERLSSRQLTLLCDLRLKSQEFGPAERCNDLVRDEAIRRNDQLLLARANGRRALFALSERRYDDVIAGLETDASDGGRYVRALAQARRGDLEEDGIDAAVAPFRFRYDPRPVFYAASLFAAAGDCKRALQLLEDPERRLLADYGLAPSGAAMRNRAPFRLDVFDEFGFGWFDDLSFAPAGNVYVEILAVQCLRRQDRPLAAAEHLDRLLAFPDLPAYRDVHWLAVYEAGLVRRAQNDLPGAIAQFREAVDVVESARSAIVTENGRIAFAVDKQDLYGDLVDALLKDNRTEEALEYAERAKSRALVDMLAGRKDFAPPDIAPGEAGRLVGALAAAEGSLTQAALRGDGDAAAAFAAVRKANDRIRQSSPALASLVSARPRRFGELVGVLEPDEAAVVYYKSPRHWHAFLLSGGRLTAFDLGNQGIKAKAIRFRGAASNPDDGRFATSAQQLYEAILAPVLNIASESKLLIVPHGDLHNVPFAALDDGSGPLIAKRSLRMAPSLSALVEERGHTAMAGRRGLIFGNPKRLEPGSTLEAAGKEVKELKEIFPTAEVHTDSEATVDRFRREVAGKAFVHVAAHGQFTPMRPLNSRLMFSSVTRGASDLTVGDLYGMRIDVPMAVLSACQSAFSEIAPGDDFIGLVRGFLFSGVESVVAGYWVVSSDATKMLMIAYYRELKSGASGAEAMRRAQLQVRGRYPHPYYWAAFSVMGADTRM